MVNHRKVSPPIWRYWEDSIANPIDFKIAIRAAGVM
jgi:hypothetical protein